MGYSAESVAQGCVCTFGVIRWWKTANEKMNAATLVSEAQAHGSHCQHKVLPSSG